MLDVIATTAGSLGKEALYFASSTVVSLLAGKAQKHKTQIPNGSIPFNNSVMCGGMTSASGGDLGDTVASIGGALFATLIHKGFRRFFPRKPVTR